MITVNYFDNEWAEDPYVRDFDDADDVREWVMDWGEDKGFLDSYDEHVWLFTSGGEHGEVFVTSYYGMVAEMLMMGHLCDSFDESDNTLIIQQYETWEDAYAVALGMRESQKNCYN